jgi:ElaB/YqjD/DUF883 family membrane-anchored ribosome-binding protein
MGEGADPVTSNDDALWRSDQGATETDDEVEERIDDIEQTRSEMTRTADELGRRLNPATIVESAKETAREATVGKVEAMATTAGDMVSDVGTQARDTGTGIVDTIRRNPVPAAIAAVGLGLLWMNRAPAPQRDYRYVSQTNGGPDIGDKLDDARRQVGRTASGAVDTAGRKVSDAADTVGRKADDFADTARMTAEDFGGTANRLIEENPLAASAIALAVGTAVGLAMPPTRVEQRLMGDASARVVDKAQDAVEGQLQDAERSIRDADVQAALSRSA